MDPSIAINLQNICKSFKIETEDVSKNKTFLNKHPTKTVEHKVLDNLNFSVKKGEMVGVIGLNGSGKSTLLSIMARIMEPDSGTIEINGKVASILELGMGFHQDLSGRENIYIKGGMYGFTKEQIDERIDRIIDFSGLRNYIDNPLRTYSSGMSGRLAFSVMVNVDAEIMLLDEIMSTGDPSFLAKADNLFKKQLKNGKTVVFASQSHGQIEQLCSRAIWISNGKIVADGPAKSVCAMFQNSINESLEIVTDFANNGVADAQYRLAMFYKDGQKVEKNLDLYKEWLGKAAAQGHPAAQTAYADILMELGGEQNVADALVYYQSAAQKGNNDAKMKLSSLTNGGPNSEDLIEIRDIMHQLAETGHPSNKFQYAMLMLSTAWNDEDRKTAFEWFKRSADEDGDPGSMFRLALMYRDGIAVPRDTDKCIEYLQKGAEQGSLDCFKNLADIYFAGKIAVKDDAKAFGYFLKCAELGNPPSMFQVAGMYRDGIGTEPNKKESDKWFSIFATNALAGYQFLASEQMKLFPVKTSATRESLLKKSASTGYLRSINTLASIYRGDTSLLPDLEQSRLYYETAANWAGGARLILADLYYKGIVFEQDFKKCAELYKNLTYCCDANVDFRLYQMYRDGKGFEKDFEKSMYFLKRSASRGNLDACEELRKYEC